MDFVYLLFGKELGVQDSEFNKPKEWCILWYNGLTQIHEAINLFEILVDTNTFCDVQRII